MKVKELIEALGKYDPEMVVNIENHEIGPTEAEMVGIDDSCELFQYVGPKPKRVRVRGVLIS